MTACSTLISPLMTPFWMKVLAGRLVPVDFLAMMVSIINMIIVPIAAGLAANRILYSQKRWARESRVLLGVFGSGLVISLAFGFLDMTFMGPIAQMKSGLVLGFSLIAVVALAKFLVQNVFRGPADWMDKALPVVSMAGICIIIAIITARSRNDLLTSGLLLILAGVMHNAVGYSLGYWGARVFRLSETDCRTVSLEVGMQNGGMATGIAMEVLQSAKAALAPAIFGPWMNISGSVLASWWRRRPAKR
jgi:BASS family bile acid:Na+ symporter